jgi:hypothetical protein
LQIHAIYDPSEDNKKARFRLYDKDELTFVALTGLGTNGDV